MLARRTVSAVCARRGIRTMQTATRFREMRPEIEGVEHDSMLLRDPYVSELARSKRSTAPLRRLYGMIGDKYDKDIWGSSGLGIQGGVPGQAASSDESSKRTPSTDTMSITHEGMATQIPELSEKMTPLRDLIKEEDLDVITDVYLTREELRTLLEREGLPVGLSWKVGAALPADARVGAREAAALLGVTPRETLGLCVRARADDLVGMRAAPPTGALAYGLAFAGTWRALRGAVLANAWFFTKTVPFLGMAYLGLARSGARVRAWLRGEGPALAVEANEVRLTNEDAILEALRDRATDVDVPGVLGAWSEAQPPLIQKYGKARAQLYAHGINTTLLSKLNEMRVTRGQLVDGAKQEALEAACTLTLKHIKPGLDKLLWEAGLREISGDKDPIRGIRDRTLVALHECKPDIDRVENATNARAQKDFNFRYSMTENEKKRLLALPKDTTIETLKAEADTKLLEMVRNICARLGMYIDDTIENSIYLRVVDLRNYINDASGTISSGSMGPPKISTNMPM